MTRATSSGTTTSTQRSVGPIDPPESGSVVSETEYASQSRRSRLSKQQQYQASPTKDDKALTLAERRRARQQKKKQVSEATDDLNRNSKRRLKVNNKQEQPQQQQQQKIIKQDQRQQLRQEQAPHHHHQTRRRRSSPTKKSNQQPQQPQLGRRQINNRTDTGTNTKIKTPPPNKGQPNRTHHSTSSPVKPRPNRQTNQQQQKQPTTQVRKTLGHNRQISHRQPPTHPSQPRRPRPSSERAALYSNRRFVHTISQESDSDNDPHKQIQQAFPQANLHHLPTSRRQPAFEDEYTHSPNGSEDDEQTLTSVRQIMNTTQEITTASSSSFEAPQKMYEVQASSSTPGPVFFVQSRQDDDTLLFEDVDDADSVTFEQRRKEAEKRKQQQPVDGYIDGAAASSPLVNRDDLEHYRKILNTPVVQTAVGLAAAATVGTMLLGPVGLLVGAATVGIGVGVMQIPEEQRANVRDKATNAMKKAQEKAMDASETLSNTCSSGFQELGISQQFPNEMKQCFTTGHANMMGDESGAMATTANNTTTTSAGAEEGLQTGGDIVGGRLSSSPPQSKNNRRVACLRNVRIVPVNQIHGLEPAQQPRAWLDVMASSQTDADEKNEAMEEILILAKDKRHARFLLEEGILDSLIYIVTRYFDSVASRSSISPAEHAHAKLAAMCCVTLGKAHCAAVHTEGDLLLMSLYERGSVPEERQLAQMLYEVPHHVLTKEPDEFVLQNTSMTLAEDLSGQIKQLVSSYRQ